MQRQKNRIVPRKVIPGYNSRTYTPTDLAWTDFATGLVDPISKAVGLSPHTVLGSIAAFTGTAAFDVKYLDGLRWVASAQCRRAQRLIESAQRRDRVKSLFDIFQYRSTPVDVALLFTVVFRSMGIAVADEMLFSIYLYCVRFKRTMVLKREKSFVLHI